jgi:hypothetical protein
MKPWPLFIGILFILAMVCSPGLAVISKSDLISQYKAGQYWEPVTPTPSPTVIPTTEPTPTPTTNTTNRLCPTDRLSVTSTPSRATVFIDGYFKGSTPITIYGLSAGTHQLKVSFPTYEDYSTEILIPEPLPCHVSSYGLQYCEIQLPITIDVTLKKIESTQKPTIPTIMPKTQYPSLFL